MSGAPEGWTIGTGLCLAFLRERAAVARRLAAKDVGCDDALLQDRARQLEIVVGEIEQGMHLPETPVFSGGSGSIDMAERPAKAEG